jgi:hypothetical protein
MLIFAPTYPTRGCADERLLDCAQQIFVFNGLGQEIHGTAVHGGSSHKSRYAAGKAFDELPNPERHIRISCSTQLTESET